MKLIILKLSEIKSTELPKILTINSLIKYFEDCELGTIILPLYVYKAKKTKNEDDSKKFQNIILI